MRIRFNYPHTTGKEIKYIKKAIEDGVLSGNGTYTKLCQKWLIENTKAKGCLLTHSCTGALEMAAILADISAGDEVIMPSYTFVSTANAFVLRGGIPVFIDINPDTLNIDETKIPQAITSKTKAIVPVHYAGVGCEMDSIMDIATDHNLIVIEDAAQGFASTYKDNSLGAIGHLGTLSFHETKNIISGEGGALLINDERFLERAEIIWEKGTNRSQFFRGEIDKYTWIDIGSSFLPSDLVAAFLYAQMENADTITSKRIAVWNRFNDAFEQLEEDGKLIRPKIPHHCTSNAHIYYFILNSLSKQREMLEHLANKNIQGVFHYVPLHSSPAGKKFGKVSEELIHTDDLSRRLIRLPIWPDLSLENQEQIILAVKDFFED